MVNPFDLETAEYHLVISPSAHDTGQPKPPSTMLRS